MPAIITQQPNANQLLSAYKPMVIECTATTSIGGVPTLVLCDVYINSVYYRTFFSSKADKEGKYTFDIQDAVQEKLTYFIPPIDGSKLEITTQTIVDVIVKIRTTKLNASGLNETEQIAPIPGTEETQPISGEGISSNKFFALNLLIQHEENQDLKSLLNSYRTNEWNSEALPLTRRNKINFLTDSQSSFFPFVSDKKAKTICVNVKFKGQSNFTPYCKVLTIDDNNEVSNPPVVEIKWKNNNATEDRSCSSSNCVNLISILKSDPDNDITSQQVLVSTDNGVTWSVLSNLMIDELSTNSNSANNFWYKATVEDSKSNTGTSNILKINKQTIILPLQNFHYKAVHPNTHPSDDTVTYLDEYSAEHTTILPRSADAVNNACTLIVASSIVGTVGAVTCTPEPEVTMTTYRAWKYGNSGDDVTIDYYDKDGLQQQALYYAPGGTMAYYMEVYACAITGTATSNGTLEEIGPC